MVIRITVFSTPIMQLTLFNFWHRAPLDAALQQHLQDVTACLLRAHGVKDASRWCPIVTCLAEEAAASISPDLVSAKGNLDPRVHIKVPLCALQKTAAFLLLCSRSCTRVWPNPRSTGALHPPPF